MPTIFTGARVEAVDHVSRGNFAALIVTADNKKALVNFENTSFRVHLENDYIDLSMDGLTYAKRYVPSLHVSWQGPIHDGYTSEKLFNTPESMIKNLDSILAEAAYSGNCHPIGDASKAISIVQKLTGSHVSARSKFGPLPTRFELLSLFNGDQPRLMDRMAANLVWRRSIAYELNAIKYLQPSDGSETDCTVMDRPRDPSFHDEVAWQRSLIDELLQLLPGTSIEELTEEIAEAQAAVAIAKATENEPSA